MILSDRIRNLNGATGIHAQVSFNLPKGRQAAFKKVIVGGLKVCWMVARILN